MFDKKIKRSVLAILCAAAMAASTGCATNAGNTQNQSAEAAVEGQSTGGPAEDQSATAAPEGQNADQNADQNQTAWNAFTDVPDDDSDEWKKTSLPKEETYALSDQMRRAAVSIPSNIAEGQGRESCKEFVRFLSMARGSLRELSTQLKICERLHYIDESNTSTSSELITEVDKMITSLATKLKQKTDN